MKIDLSQFLETFLQESAEHIVDIENGLLQMKTTGSDDETLNSIFRAAHSIKGGAGAFGLTNVVRFTHVLENLFDAMREHRVEVSADLIALLLRANDVLKEVIDSKDESLPPDINEVRLALEKASSEVSVQPARQPAGPDHKSTPQSLAEVEYIVRFKPLADLFGIGSDPLLLLRNLAALGHVTCVKLDDTGLPSLRSLSPEVSYLGWEIEITTAATRADLDEIFEFVFDCIVLQITEKPSASQVTTPHRIEPIRERPRDNAPVKASTGKSENSSVRVPTEKIDKLIDLVGEMVIAHSITTRLVDNISPDNITALQESVASLGRYIRELHERTMSVRMLPLGSLFSRFHRLVHDLAEKTGKRMKLITEGDETEVDRGILELLGDPLTHIIRNSADHGIENPVEREQAGKPPEGTILLRASHMAGTILVEIIDDGAGLNLARIREKALDRNLIAPDALMTDEQIRLLIFEPGFSTKEAVSDLSGRGVGMDVVKRNVTALHGSISLDSEHGNGTHLKIQLPLTLAIMEGLIVRVGTHSFVIPLVSILETVCLRNSEVHDVAGQGEVALIRDETLPFLRLKTLFKLQSAVDEADNPLGDRKLAVVVEHSNQRAALEIDELLGQQQIVVKSLERNFTKLDGTLGATILGDGRAALILDAHALIAGRSKSAMTLNGRARMSLVA